MTRTQILHALDAHGVAVIEIMDGGKRRLELGEYRVDVRTEDKALQAKLAGKEAKNGYTIPGLGKLVLVNRKARMGRNPQTGEAIKIAARRVVRFRVAKAMKDSVLGGKK